MEVTWPIFKDFVDARKVSIQWIDVNDHYYLKAFDSSFSISCSIYKLDEDGTYKAQFEASYKALGNKPMGAICPTSGRALMPFRPFSDSEGFRFRGKGVSGLATASTVTNIDLKITEERFINGCEVILKDQAFGDSCNFEIVDVDNIIGYGAGVVLDRFAESWFFSGDVQDQGQFILDYPAKIIAGLYIRIAYTSTGGTNVQVRCNYFLHKKAA